VDNVADNITGGYNSNSKHISSVVGTFGGGQYICAGVSVDIVF
jgi:hypothetical protein